jgi:hypothetical protein
MPITTAPLAGKRLGLVHWGISTPSLEEVFMRTSAAAEQLAQQSHTANGDATLGSTGAQPAPASVSEAASLPEAAAADSAAAPYESLRESHVPRTANGATGQHLPERSAGLHPKSQPASQLWQQARAFREMLRKRALIASRDVRGGVFTLLLPILAVAAVLVKHNNLCACMADVAKSSSCLVCSCDRFICYLIHRADKLIHCHVQSILKVNIDPTAPSMDLTLKRFGAATSIGHCAAMFHVG